MITLRPVTRENLDAVLRLRIRDCQKGHVSSPAESLAQAYVYRETAFPFAVDCGQETVGFIMMGYYEEKGYYTLWKLLIGREHQRRGYGREALAQGIAFLKDRFGAREIYTGVLPENRAAKSLYRSFGFEATGVFENGMEEMRLTLPGAETEEPDEPPMRLQEAKDAPWLTGTDAYQIYSRCMYRPTYEKYMEKLARLRGSPRYSVFVCEAAGENTGIIALEQQSRDTAEIVGIAVREGRQGRGAGRVMIRAAALRLGVQTLLAETDGDSAGFYERAGFSVRTFTRRFPDGDAARYACVLTITAPEPESGS